LCIDFISTASYTINNNNNNSPTNNNNNNNNNNNKKDEDRKHKIYAHNPYNGVVYNDIILATGVFSSKELWKMSKGMIINRLFSLSTYRAIIPASILQDTSGDSNIGSNASSSSNSSTTNNIKIENTNSYYCSSYSNPPPVITSISGGYNSELKFN
jgi:hypothetical protein